MKIKSHVLAYSSEIRGYTLLENTDICDLSRVSPQYKPSRKKRTFKTREPTEKDKNDYDCITFHADHIKLS